MVEVLEMRVSVRLHVRVLATLRSAPDRALLDRACAVLLRGGGLCVFVRAGSLV